MGYVNPDREPEPRDFEEQFQWDGHGWLFRRFHRARPVRVTPEEMEQSISFYHRWRNRIFAVSSVTGIGLVVAWDIFGSKEWERAHFDVTTAIGGMAFALAWLARNWVWRKAIDRYAGRVPVGIGQSWIEDREAQVAEAGWANLLTPIALLGLFAAMVIYFRPVDQSHWLELGAFGLVGLAAVFDIFLKFRAKLL